jgi:hypothetical protein
VFEPGLVEHQMDEAAPALKEEAPCQGCEIMKECIPDGELLLNELIARIDEL